MTHTPRPWRVVQRRAGGAFTPKNGLTLRHLAVDTGSVVWTPSRVQTGGYTEDHLEQAHLIAGAPQLLRELKEARRGLEMAIRGIESPDFRESCAEFLPSIDAAIAKASGGAA